MSDTSTIMERALAGGIGARRPGDVRAPEADMEVLGDFWRPVNVASPGAWIARDGLACVAGALGVSLLAAAEAVALQLGVAPKRPLRWCWVGFELSGFGWHYGEAIERLEAAALRARFESLLFCRRSRPLGAEHGQSEALSGG